VPQRFVRDLMRIRHGLVVPESMSLRQAAERLIISDCDLLAVTDTQGKLVGVVGESSVVRALMANPAENATIQSIVTRTAESIRLDSSLASVVPLFRSSANTAIPVIDATDCVCGLLMRRDVITCLLNRNAEPSDSSPMSEVTSSVKPTVLSSVFRPPQSRVIHSAESDSANSPANHQSPHFLRSDEARRILWASEDRL